MSLSIAEMARQSHELAKAKGWWEGRLDPADRTFIPEKLMLIVSECSEALELYRQGEAGSASAFNLCPDHPSSPFRVTNLGSWLSTCPSCSKPLKPVGFNHELADIVIRVGDLAERLGIDLEQAVVEKHAYNQTRSLRHGGKVC